MTPEPAQSWFPQGPSVQESYRAEMKTLEHIRLQLCKGKFEFSRHAFKRVVERNISELEIRQAGEQARIIEDYPIAAQFEWDLTEADDEGAHSTGDPGATVPSVWTSSQAQGSSP